MKPLEVLVIDDESVICDACEMVLSEKGHTVTKSTNGTDGLRAIRQQALGGTQSAGGSTAGIARL